MRSATASVERNEERPWFRVEDLPDRGGCGVGGVVDLHQRATHENVEAGLAAICDNDVRGGKIGKTGDGAGIMVRTEQMRKFFERFVPPGQRLEPNEKLHIGNLFLASGDRANTTSKLDNVRRILGEHGLKVYGFRDLPHLAELLGKRAQDALPIMQQVLFSHGHVAERDLPLTLFNAKLAIAARERGVYPVSLQRGTLTYKAMLTGAQLGEFFPDFHDPDFITDALLYHIRYSTNVRAMHALAQLFRQLGHNGEIVNIAALRSALIDLAKNTGLDHMPLMPGGSDSADLDNAVEFYTAHGVPLNEAVRRLFLRASDDLGLASQDVQQFYKALRMIQGSLTAEGPAAILAMNDEEVVVSLDTDGLRPFRIIENDSGIIHMGSEIGAGRRFLGRIIRTTQLDAGDMAIIKRGRIIRPHESDAYITQSSRLNWRDIADPKRIVVLVPSDVKEKLERDDVVATFNLFGGNDKFLETYLRRLAQEGKEPTQGMGRDAPLAVFSGARPPLYNYLQGNAGVVTVPPKDAIRERGAMDPSVLLGRKPQTTATTHSYTAETMHKLEYPVMTEGELRGLISGEHPENVPTTVLDVTFEGMTKEDHDAHLAKLESEAIAIAREGKYPIIVLSDRNARDPNRLYVEMAIAVGRISRALHRCGLYRKVSIVCDTGSAMKAHDIACLISEGAHAVNPYMLWMAAGVNLMGAKMQEDEHDPKSRRDLTSGEIETNIYKALCNEVLKIYSKLGILSTRGFLGSKQFEAVGIDPLVTDYYLRGVVSKIGGITIQDLINDQIARKNFGGTNGVQRNTDKGGWHAQIRDLLDSAFWKNGGKFGTPEKAFAAFMEEVAKMDPLFLSDLLDFKKEGVAPLSAEDTAAMTADWKKTIIEEGIIEGADISDGALGLTAHRAYVGAFNALGGRAGSGEGGEDPRRATGEIWEKDISKRRQVASARFGVTAEYLADPAVTDICIKIGQGAKPGEGGQLPAGKVTARISAQRKAQSGASLISPPPHHDIYSIEDLGLLVADLKAINPEAKITVKIPAITGIGTIACGVAKAGADKILVCGFEGGTAASPISSVNHTGLPREIGLVECHQALIHDGLRDQVELRVDGAIRTPKEIVKMLALGADGVDMGTALLIGGERCIFCHSCDGSKGHCPTGITVQDDNAQRQLGNGAKKLPVLTEPETPEAKAAREEEQYEKCKAATMHQLELTAKGVLEELAKLGLNSPKQLVGRTDMLEQISRGERFDRVNLGPFLLRNMHPDYVKLKQEGIAERAERVLTRPFVNASNRHIVDEALKGNKTITHELQTADRSFGATLAGQIARKKVKIDDGPVVINTTGFAGQTLGVWCTNGMEIRHHGFANDYVAKGISGGKVVVKMPDTDLEGAENSLAGNGCAYGATGGKLFVNGRVGQRFGVRNSGALLVAEGTGKYAFEYMTGGIGINLGHLGNTIGTGMTGGELFLFDPDKKAEKRLAKDIKIVEMDAAAEQRLKNSLTEYYSDTQSKKAQTILENWDEVKGNFVHAVPKT